MTSSEKQRQFCIKSQLILIARGLFINNQKLVDLLFQQLAMKHEIRGDAFSKSLSIVLGKLCGSDKDCPEIEQRNCSVHCQFMKGHRRGFIIRNCAI